MNFKLEKVTFDKKEVLFNLLQFALYDGSQYIENRVNSSGLFDYKWFDNYFTDNDRIAYFILEEISNQILGFVMINQHMKTYTSGHSIAEFLILPNYRRHHIGTKIAFEIFNKYKGNWEIEPIENSEQATIFWNKTIFEYTNNNYESKEKILRFNNSGNKIYN